MIDTDGNKALSRRAANNEDELPQLLGDVLDLADRDPVTWAVDLNAGGAALWIALLVNHGQRLFYIPGRTVYHASGPYWGDAKDAFVADQSRMRRDLQPLQETSEIVVDLKIPTARARLATWLKNHGAHTLSAAKSAADADLISSMSGIGDMLGAAFIAATGDDMTAFGSPDRLASVAGLAPAPRDSGKVSGNLRRPRRYSRQFLRMFYLSA